MLALGACEAGGAGPAVESVGTRPAINANRGEAQPASVFERPLERLTIEFVVYRIWAPPGTFAKGDEPWSLATGDSPPAEPTLRWTANGFRMAVGRASDRPALQRYLESIEDRKVAEDRTQPDDRRALEIELGAGPAQTTLFCYGPDGRLSGRDFESPKAILRLNYELHALNLREMIVQATPELEEPPGPMKWTIDADGRAREVPQERRHLFGDLAVSVKVPENGFLMIGPTDAAHEMPILGRAFFVDYGGKPTGSDEERRESLYIITPVIRSSADESGSGRRRPGSGLNRQGGDGQTGG